MGKVSELLIEMIKRQVADRGMVVWYDPQKDYNAFIEGLELSDATILKYGDGFFPLRQRLEPFLEYVTDDGGMVPDADQPPSVVVYVPMARDDCNFALIEAETAGVVMEPGSGRPECNTRLGTLAQRAFEAIAPVKAEHHARQADEGLLSLEELDRMAEDAGAKATGVLQVIFGQVSAEEILLQFLATGTRDDAISEKNALPEIAALFQSELGLKDDGFDSPVALRETARSYVLMGDLMLQIPESDLPEAWRNLPIPDNPAHCDLIRHVCKVWRNRLDLKEFYTEAANKVEQRIGLTEHALPLAHLEKADTFMVIERRYLNHATAKLIDGLTAEVLAITSVRQSLFWTRELPTFQLEWKVIEAAAKVIQEAARIEKELKQRKWEFEELIQAYACHAEPWLQLDMMARHLEMRYARLDLFEWGTEKLEKAVALARHRYADTVHALASVYSISARKAEFRSKRFKPQTQIFTDVVRPILEKGLKTAFFLVDAFRFEMAVDLLEGLGPDYKRIIEPIVGQLPGITTVGMAALLPGAEQGLGLEKKAGGLAVSLSGKTLSSRQSRMQWIKEQSGAVTVVYRLGELLKLSPKRKKEIGEAQLIVVTSQEIDRIGEASGDEEEARIYIGDVLEKLRRAIRSLTLTGVQQFILSADHGFLLVEAMDPGMAMDVPGGETTELHSRVWIGNGGESAEGYLRFNSSDLELGGSLELAFPRGLGIFKVKGGTGAFFHGGISLQEHLLPLLTVKALKVGKVAKPDMLVKVFTAKTKVTNRLFTITIKAEGKGLFPDTEKRIRVAVVSGKSEVGAAVAASYGFEESTREVKIKIDEPNVITLMISASESPKTLTVQIIDCESQVVLDALKDIPVDLGI